MNSINIVVPPELVNKIDDLAGKTKKSRSRLFRDAVIEYYHLDNELVDEPAQNGQLAE